MGGIDIYGGQDPRFLPSYSFGEAALCLRLPAATLRIWALGRPYPTLLGERTFEPMFELADRKGRRLSFVNLLEAHVLRGLRTEQRFTMRHVRRALRELQYHGPKKHPLAFEDFLTDGVDIFVDRFGKQINQSQAGQVAMKETLVAHLMRIERAERGPVSFSPFLRSEDLESPRPVSVTPTVAFGRPVVAGTGVATEVIAGRVNAGDPVEAVAEDLDLTPKQVKDAILFEQRFRAA